MGLSVAPSRLIRLAGAADSGMGAVAVAGLAVVLAYHRRRWQDDRDRAVRFRDRLARPRPALRATPLVTILVAAWNEAPFLERHIRSVQALRYPAKQYVLCAGGADETLAIARRFAGPAVTVLEQAPGEGKQRALQRALRHARGEIVYLTDSDCALDDESFERTLAPLVNEGAAAATGGARPLEGADGPCPLAALQHRRELYTAAGAADWSAGLLGRNAAVGRKAIEACHGLEEPAPTGTDYRLARALMRHGYRIRLVPTSLVATIYPCTPRAYVRQQSRWLRNLLVHGLATGDRYHVRHALTTALAGLSLTGGLLAALVQALYWRRIGLFWAWLLVAIHACLSRTRQLGAAAYLAGPSPTPRRHSALLIPAWIALDAAVWTVVPFQSLSRKARRQW